MAALTSPPTAPSTALLVDSPHNPTSTQHVLSALSTPPPPALSHTVTATTTHHEHNRHSSPIHIRDSSLSPQRFRRVWTDGDEREKASGSPVRDLMEEEWRYHHAPSSPLLTAMREAVDSINQYEDFEILEKIGAGFFADVYKVRKTRCNPYLLWSTLCLASLCVSVCVCVHMHLCVSVCACVCAMTLRNCCECICSVSKSSTTLRVYICTLNIYIQSKHTIELCRLFT